MSAREVALRYVNEELGYHLTDDQIIGTEPAPPHGVVVLFEVGPHQALGIGVEGDTVVEEIGHPHLVDRGII